MLNGVGAGKHAKTSPLIVFVSSTYFFFHFQPLSLVCPESCIFMSVFLLSNSKRCSLI